MSYLISYKPTNNERIGQDYCLYVKDNLRDTIFHFIEANKMLLKKNYYSSLKCC